MRTFVAAPKAEGQYPGIWCYSDIFQLTPPLLRTCVRLAGYGFVAAAPEIYRRIEPPGTVIPFDDAGRTRGQQDAAKTPVAHFDADCRAGLDWLSKHAKVARGKIGAMGFCIGGPPRVPRGASAGCPRHGLFLRDGHSRRQAGPGRRCGSLARAGEIRGELLMVFGTNDPHVPAEGRKTIDEGCASRRALTSCCIPPSTRSSATKARVSIQKRPTSHLQR